MNSIPQTSHIASGRWMWLTIFLAAACFYTLTAQQGVSWQDSGEYQWRCLRGDFVQGVPLCRSHPSYIAMGWGILKLTGGNAWALNAFSGVAAAIALANLSALGALLTARRWVSLVVVLALGMSHAFWWLASVAEIYSLSVALLTANLYLLVKFDQTTRKRFFFLLVFLNGLGVSVHNFALLPIPVYVVYFAFATYGGKLRWGDWLWAAGLWLVGASPLIAACVFQGVTNQLSITELIREATVGPYSSSVTNLIGQSKHFRANVILSAMSGLNPLWVLAIIGVVRVWARQGRAIASSLVAITVIQVVFFVRYPVPDQFTFILPTLVMIAVLGCVGLGALADWATPKWRAVLACAMLLSAVAQPIVYAAGSRYVQQNVGQIRKRELPFRNEADYWLTPWKHNKDSAARFASAALQTAAPNGVIIADGTAIYPLLLTQRLSGDGDFRGVTVYEPGDFVKAACGGDPDKVVAACVEMLDGRALFVVVPENLPKQLTDVTELKKTPDGSLYRVIWR